MQRTLRALRQSFSASASSNTHQYVPRIRSVTTSVWPVLAGMIARLGLARQIVEPAKAVIRVERPAHKIHVVDALHQRLVRSLNVRAVSVRIVAA